MNPIDYESLLNRTIMEVKPSGIRRFFDIANEMDDVISLSIGEPDFSTPWHIRQVGRNDSTAGGHRRLYAKADRSGL